MSHLPFLIGGWVVGTALAIGIAKGMIQEHGGIKVTQGGWFIIILGAIVFGFIVGWAVAGVVAFYEAMTNAHVQ